MFPFQLSPTGTEFASSSSESADIFTDFPQRMMSLAQLGRGQGGVSPQENGGGRQQNGEGRPENGGGRHGNGGDHSENGGGRHGNGGGHSENGGGHPENGGGVFRDAIPQWIGTQPMEAFDPFGQQQGQGGSFMHVVQHNCVNHFYVIESTPPSTTQVNTRNVFNNQPISSFAGRGGGLQPQQPHVGLTNRFDITSGSAATIRHGEDDGSGPILIPVVSEDEPWSSRTSMTSPSPSLTSIE